MTDVAPEKTEPPKTTVSITIDGKEIEAKPGELLIAAAERHGIYIPRFCYHPRMRPVGMCRMCLVDVKGPRGFALTPSCFVSVAEGQEVVTDSPRVKKAQDGVLEFLLVNHPLDCPVCDKGGECPLQDQTLTFGPGETRFIEEKRHFEKPIALSDLVYLDRERCIQCDRCTRFADEVAGDPLIEFIGRGDHIEVNTFPDEPFSSYFSGNTVQICPVGALTAKPYRFRARPWDLEQVESSCTSCTVGCRVAVQSSGNHLTRYLGIDSEPVNHGWLCDKGRFDFEAVNSEDRLACPKVRKGDQLVDATWGEALAAASEGLNNVKTLHGPELIGVIGGARLANEDAYVWARVAKAVLGTDNVDCQLGDGLPAEVVLGLPRATIDQATAAPAVVLLGPDLKEELPVLYLRLRAAALEQNLPIIELTPKATGMTRYAAHSLAYRPGEAAALARALVDGGTATWPACRRRPSRRRAPPWCRARSSCSGARRWRSRPHRSPKRRRSSPAGSKTCASCPRCGGPTCTALSTWAWPRACCRAASASTRGGRGSKQRGARSPTIAVSTAARCCNTRPTVGCRAWFCSAPTRSTITPTTGWPSAPWPGPASCWPSTRSSTTRCVSTPTSCSRLRPMPSGAAPPPTSRAASPG